MMAKPDTLIVESNESDRTFLQQSLEGAGYLATAVDTAVEALDRLRDTPFDLVVTALELDNGPGGLRVARAVKWRWPRTPVIITARNGSFDTAKAAIDLGVDGYLLKPVESAELKDTAQRTLERQRACHCTEGTPVLRWRGLALDKHKAEATLNGEPVDLTPTEFKLLRYLMENDYRVVSPEELFEASRDRAPRDRERARDAIRWHIYNIRQKIEPDPQDPVYVLNVYGLGYTFADAETQ
jgi:DNA-binding response OmpR family regulator